MNTNTTNKHTMTESFSAWLDGELSEPDATACLQKTSKDTKLQDDWQMAHLIGDAMRGEASVSCDFSSRFAARLADEPTVFVPASAKNVAENTASKSRWSWFAYAAAASVALVFVGYLGGVGQGGAQQGGTAFVASNANAPSAQSPQALASVTPAPAKPQEKTGIILTDGHKTTGKVERAEATVEKITPSQP